MSVATRRCKICRSLLDEEDLFCPNCGTDTQADRTKAATKSFTTHTFECSGCGASMSYDPRSRALRCPFCNSQQLIEKPQQTTLRPEMLIPFALDRQTAEARLRQRFRRGFWQPRDLASQASLVAIQPVYIPYWLFRAKTHSYWTADSSAVPLGARGDWFPMFGEHSAEYASVAIHAGQSLSADEAEQILPYDFEQLRPVTDEDLQTSNIEPFAVPRKYARTLARQRIEVREAQTIARAYVPGRARNVHVNTLVEAMEGHPVLLPVWVLACRYRNKVYRFVINGQTGEVVGAMPISLWKVAIAAVSLCGLIALLVLLIRALL